MALSFGVATGQLSVRDPATGNFTQVAQDDYRADITSSPILNPVAIPTAYRVLTVFRRIFLQIRYAGARSNTVTANARFSPNVMVIPDLELQLAANSQDGLAL